MSAYRGSAYRGTDGTEHGPIRETGAPSKTDRTRQYALLALAVICVVGVALNWNPPSLTRIADFDGSAHFATAPLAGRSSAQLSLDSGTTAVNVTSADLGGRLFEAVTPPGGGQSPRAVVTADRVDLSLVSGRGGGPAEVTIVLSTRVAWSLDLAGGSSTATLDLGGVRLDTLSFAAGVSDIDVTLPRPSGGVTVLMAGGASAFTAHTPTGVPAQVRFGGGAGSASIDGTTRSGIAGGTVLATPDWTGASGGRYVFDNTAGVSSFTLQDS